MGCMTWPGTCLNGAGIGGVTIRVNFKLILVVPLPARCVRFGAAVGSTPRSTAVARTEAMIAAIRASRTTAADSGPSYPHINHEQNIMGRKPSNLESKEYNTMKSPTAIRKLLRSAIVTAVLHLASITLTQADIAGTVAEFRFDGESRNYAQAQQPLLAASIRFTTDRLGVPARALALPESGFVGSLDRDYLKGRRQWTWSAWIRSDFSGRAGQIVYSEDAHGNVANVQVSNGQAVVNTWNEDVPGNWSSAIASGTVVAGKWFHLAVTFDAGSANLGECRIFLDGQARFVGTLPMVKSSAVTVDSHAFALGRNIGSLTGGQPSQEFAGAIDDVIIFERALTPAEIPGLLVTTERLAAFPAIELEFYGRTGVTYQLQWSEDVVSWTNEGAVVVGENSPVVRFASTRTHSSRYWRLQPAGQP